MHRREVCLLGCVLLSGCSGLVVPTGVVITQIKGFNRDEMGHQLYIQIEDGNKTIFEDSIALSGTTGQKSTFFIKNELPDDPGLYSIGLSVDGDQQRMFPIHEQATSTEVGVIAEITPSGTPEIYIQD